MSKEMVMPPLEGTHRVYVDHGRVGQGYVQIASVCEDEAEFKSVAKDILAGVYDGSPFGFYATMTKREQLNDLIRKLRRARDLAFGADA